ncbi:MAG: class I SAM-dependent methyltransferase [Mycobacterium sp.]|nr:class I SAM-dependent methyltransferase [Mycobacterium sp.]MBV9721392.1 class I SAM-dependent methyltransferase [Mycobacterium sp.]
MMPGIDRDFVQRLAHVRDLTAGLDPYLERCTTPESSELAALARRTREVDWQQGEYDGELRLEQEMLTGHVEGQLLKFLVHLADARRVLEIGMFTGYSTLAMAEALPDDGIVVACEIDPWAAQIARECFARSAAGHKITVEIGSALETLRKLASVDNSALTPFDVVFIDADKAGYLDYVGFMLDSELLTPRAIIAVDNTLMQGRPYTTNCGRSANGSAIARFNSAISADPRVEQVLIPLRDGVTLIRRTPKKPLR